MTKVVESLVFRIAYGQRRKLFGRKSAGSGFYMSQQHPIALPNPIASEYLDEASFNGLYDQHAGLVFSIACRILADCEAAKDLRQDLFIGIWRKPTKFPIGDPRFTHYLAACTRNRCIDKLRTKRQTEQIDDSVIDSEDRASRDQVNRVMFNRVRDLLNTVPALQRQALELAFFEGMTHAEIALRLGQPLGTVKARIRYGLLALRAMLEGSESVSAA